MPKTSLETIESSGWSGPAGPAFPTHVKLRSKAEVVILNAAECEPLLHKDKEMLRCTPTRCWPVWRRQPNLSGPARPSWDQVQVPRRHQPPAAEAAREHADRRAVGQLPGGDEFILVYDVTGGSSRRARSRWRRGGVINVETAYNIAGAKGVTRKFLTVAGAVREPVTIEVPVGVSFARPSAWPAGRPCPIRPCWSAGS